MSRAPTHLFLLHRHQPPLAQLFKLIPSPAAASRRWLPVPQRAHSHVVEFLYLLVQAVVLLVCSLHGEGRVSAAARLLKTLNTKH